MSNIDALPYYDKEVEIAALKALALKEIENEMKGMQRVALDDPRLPTDVDVFPTSESLRALMATYADGLASGPRSMKAIDPSLWQIPELSVAQASEEEWAGAERRSRVGLEHMGIRNNNIALLQSYGPNAHLIRNYQLEAEAKELEKQVEIWKERVVEVNRARRVYQESTGQHLASLESRWQDLVSSTVQLEMANTALEGMLGNLQRRRDAAERELRDVEAQE